MNQVPKPPFSPIHLALSNTLRWRVPLGMLFAALLLGCSVQKRTTQPGWHVEAAILNMKGSPHTEIVPPNPGVFRGKTMPLLAKQPDLHSMPAMAQDPLHQAAAPAPDFRLTEHANTSEAQRAPTTVLTQEPTLTMQDSIRHDSDVNSIGPINQRERDLNGFVLFLIVATGLYIFSRFLSFLDSIGL